MPASAFALEGSHQGRDLTSRYADRRPRRHQPPISLPHPRVNIDPSLPQSIGDLIPHEPGQLDILRIRPAARQRRATLPIPASQVRDTLTSSRMKRRQTRTSLP